MAAIERLGPVETLLADGGPTANRTLMQLQADTERTRRRRARSRPSCRRSAPRTSPGASRGSGRQAQLEALDRPRELYEPARGAGLAPRARRRVARGRRPRRVTRRRPPMSRFEGQTVVVTGAGGGIGKGIAARFAAEGATRGARRPQRGGARSGRRGARWHRRPGRHHGPRRRGRASFDAAERVDVLVNNAGIITITGSRSSRSTTGTVSCASTRPAPSCAARPPRPGCAAQGGGGRILNAASGQARQGFIYTPHYAASKFGVVGLTQIPRQGAGEGSDHRQRVLPRDRRQRHVVLQRPRMGPAAGRLRARRAHGGVGRRHPARTGRHQRRRRRRCCCSWPPARPPTSPARRSTSTAACS